MSQLGSNGTVGASFLTEAEAAEKQLEEIREGVGGVVRKEDHLPGLGYVAVCYWGNENETWLGSPHVSHPWDDPPSPGWGEVGGMSPTISEGKFTSRDPSVKGIFETPSVTGSKRIMGFQEVAGLEIQENYTESSPFHIGHSNDSYGGFRINSPRTTYISNFCL